MLSHGGFTHCYSLSQNHTSKSLLFPTKPHLNFVLNQVSHRKLPSFHAGIRTGFRLFASKTTKKIDKTVFQVEEIEDEDDDVEEIEDYDDDDDDDDEVFEDDDEDGDDIDVAEMAGDYKALLKSNKPKGFGEGKVYDTSQKDKLLAEMADDYKALLKSNKPKGFGEVKVYDTSLEDKLLAEIKQSEAAQAATLNKLKNSPQSGNSKKITQKKSVKKASPSGVPVRLRNLPRKKNIKRDLRVAFKEFPGILNIVPAVNENSKTKEPSCKGHAFVYFKSQNEANRFVELFSGQILTFGNIQKQINCVVVDSSSPNATDEHAVDKIALPLLATDPSSEDINPQLVTNSEDSVDEKNVSKTRLYTGILDNFTSLDSIDIDNQELEDESATDVGPLENQKENEAKGKNASSMRKGEKTRKAISLG